MTIQSIDIQNEMHWPLGPEQAALMDQLEPGAHDAAGTRLAHQVATIRVNGALDLSRLREALRQVVSAHQALRWAFAELPGYRGMRQREITTSVSIGLDTERAEKVVAPEDVADLVSALRSQPLDWRNGESIAATVFRTGATSWIIALRLATLAADQGSLPVLLRHLEQAYAGDFADASADDVFQFGQYVEWRQELSEEAAGQSGQEAQEGARYWTGYLDGGGPEFRLPYRLESNGEPHSATAKRQSLTIDIDTSCMARIADLAARNNATSAATLQLAWWSLLSRLNGNAPVLGGWQHDCRTDYEVMQDSIGVFDKVMPVSVVTSGDLSFESMLEGFCATLEQHLGMQEYWTAPAGFRAGIGFCHLEGTSSRKLGWTLESLPGPSASFEMALQVTEAGGAGSPQATIHYDATRYRRADVIVLLEQYLRLLDGIASHPEMPCASIDLAGDAQPAAGGISILDAGTKTVAERIAAWSEATPDAPALVQNGTVLTYRELQAKANRLSHWMLSQGVGREKPVALCLERSADLVVALLAAWQAGAAYLPLDPRWPVARIAAILSDAQPSVVLHGGQVEELGAANISPLFDISAIPTDGLHDAAPEYRAGLDDVAYVLYTSGSTGTPKGVVVEHRHLLNYVAGASHAMALGQSRRWALTGTVAADLGNTALFGALFNGACLVIADAMDMQDAASFARFVRQNAVDGVKLVPSHLEALLEHEAPALPGLVVLGGEATPMSLVRRILDVRPDCRIFNHYGPTETTVGVMIHAVDKQDIDGAVLPLSSALPNCRIHVLDAAGRPVPVGALGEIYVGGAQVARGYLNRDGGQVFIDEPSYPGCKMYRTGDLAYRLPGGIVRLAGRADHQVKIRGFRVELAEVEAALLAAPQVQQAAVLAVSNEGKPLELVAFLVARNETGQTDFAPASSSAREALHGYAASQLPAHMLPSRYVFLPAFPRLGNGKIDRTALVRDAVAVPEQAKALAPRDAIEFVVAASMAELLGRADIGVDQDFFELGGHSLLAIKLTARIRKQLQVEVAPGQVFDHANAAALAKLIRGLAGDVAQLEKLAEARRRLAQMSPEEREALAARARQNKAEAA